MRTGFSLGGVCSRTGVASTTFTGLAPGRISGASNICFMTAADGTTLGMRVSTRAGTNDCPVRVMFRKSDEAVAMGTAVIVGCASVSLVAGRFC